MSELKASAAQIRIIHCLKQALRIDESEYRNALSTWGVSSSKDFEFHAAAEFIDRLEKVAIKRGVWTKQASSQPRTEDRPGFASNAQIAAIRAKWSEITTARDPKSSQAGLEKLLLNKFKVGRLEWLRAKDVPGVFAALRGIRIYNEKKRLRAEETRDDQPLAGAPAEEDFPSYNKAG